MNDWYQNSIATTIVLPIVAFLIFWVHSLTQTKAASFNTCFVQSVSKQTHQHHHSIYAGANWAQFSVLLLLPLAQLSIAVLLCVISLYLTNKNSSSSKEATSLPTCIFVFSFISLIICADSVLSFTRSLAAPVKREDRFSLLVARKKKSTMTSDVASHVTYLQTKSSSPLLQKTIFCCGSCVIKAITWFEWILEVYQKDFTYETGIFYLEIQLAAEVFEVANQVFQLFEFAQVRDVLYLHFVCVLLLLNSFSVMLPVVFRRCLHAERTAKNLLVVCDTLLDVSYLILALSFLSICQFANSPFLSTTSIVAPCILTVDKLRDVVEYTRNQVSEHMIRAMIRAENLRKAEAAEEASAAASLKLRTKEGKEKGKGKQHTRTITSMSQYAASRRNSMAEFQKRVPGWVQLIHMILSILFTITTVVVALMFLLAAKQGYSACEEALGAPLWEAAYPKVVIGHGAMAQCHMEKIRQIKITSGNGHDKIKKLPIAIMNLTLLERFEVPDQDIQPDGISWAFLNGDTINRLVVFNVSGSPIAKTLDVSNQGAVDFPIHALTFMKELESIDLSNSTLTCLPVVSDLLGFLPKLVFLNVSNNPHINFVSPNYILDAPVSIDVSLTLTELHWAHQIEKGTKEKYMWQQIALHFPQVLLIDLSLNEITCIPTNEFIKFHRLESLIFTHNNFAFGMSTCEKVFEYITGTRVPDFYSNQSVSFWTPFKHELSPPNLKTLDFRNNEISSLAFMNENPAGLEDEGFSCLELLHLSRLRNINVDYNLLVSSCYCRCVVCLV